MCVEHMTVRNASGVWGVGRHHQPVALRDPRYRRRVAAQFTLYHVQRALKKKTPKPDAHEPDADGFALSRTILRTQPAHVLCVCGIGGIGICTFTEHPTEMREHQNTRTWSRSLGREYSQ